MPSHRLHTIRYAEVLGWASKQRARLATKRDAAVACNARTVVKNKLLISKDAGLADARALPFYARYRGAMRDCPKCGATLAAGEHGCRYCGAGAARPPSAVEILELGPNKMMVIRVLHATLKCGLKEAMDCTEGPLPLRITVDAARAPQMVADLVAAGARARLA